MTPSGNAWISRRDGLDRAVEVVASWLRDNGVNYQRRALLIPHKRDLTHPAPAIARFIANDNIGSSKSVTARAGGPVLALVPRLELLASAVGLADKNALGVVEHAEGEIAGWAAATGAVDLGTNESTPDIAAALREAMESVHDAGYNGYSLSDTSLLQRIDADLQALADAGLAFRFVAGYLVGLGAAGHRLEGLEKIYSKYQRS